jgi:protein-S-isoprenylcysteine O-methyltransferase Ste14
MEPHPRIKTQLLFPHLLNDFLGLLGMAIALFWSAGRLDWWPAWAAILVWIVWFGSMDIFVLFKNPRLMEERLHPPKDAKAWDRAIMSSVRLIQLARYILAGLDVRYGWTTGFPVWAQIAGLLACAPANILFIRAMISNPFFSQLVRLQEDQGHSVATGGPYRFVRHPGYAAMLLFELGLSVLFGSWPSILTGVVAAVLFVLRTALEDRTLQAELPGYREYATQVRYRLIPGIW